MLLGKNYGSMPTQKGVEKDSVGRVQDHRKRNFL